MRKIYTLGIIGTLLLGACNQTAEKKVQSKNVDTVVVPKADILISEALTSEQQEKLTPDSVLQRMK